MKKAKVRVAFNGFGQIGMNVFRLLWGVPWVEIVGVLVPARPLSDRALSLEYDAYRGRWLGHDIRYGVCDIVIDGKSVPFYDVGGQTFTLRGIDADVIIECSGVFQNKPDALKYFSYSARKVIVTYPAVGADATIVMGVNHELYDAETSVISAASCTTNCVAPILSVLMRAFPGELIECSCHTVHAATGSQAVLDVLNQISSYTTGASKALGEIFPELKSSVIVSATRVPTPEGSKLDMHCVFKRPIPIFDIAKAFVDESKTRLCGVLGTIDIPLKKDCSGFHRFDTHSALVNVASISGTEAGTLRSFYAWYNNVFAYSCRVRDLVEYIAGREGWIDVRGECEPDGESIQRPEYQVERLL